MGKIVLHTIVALAVWFGLSFFDLHWGIKLGAVVVGAIIVDIVWKQFIYDPFLYLGAMPFATDDPLMLEAVEKARQSHLTSHYCGSRKKGKRLAVRPSEEFHFHGGHAHVATSGGSFYTV